MCGSKRYYGGRIRNYEKIGRSIEMSKANQALSQPVKSLLRAGGVKIKTYEELKSKAIFSMEELATYENLNQDMETKLALHWNEMNLIAVDDQALTSAEVANELVLHELVHMTTDKFAKEYEGEAGRQTKECVAQVGMFKLTLVLGLNPAYYADVTLDYIKQFPMANFKRVEIDSDKAVEYLVKGIGMERVA